MATPFDVRFAADAMLQSLAKWLRLLGYDCVAGNALFGRRVVELAAAERRWLLTRNRRFEGSQPRDLLARTSIFQVAADALPEQLREVAARFELDLEAFAFTRCVRCNAPLALLGSPADAPVWVREFHTKFWRCPACGRVYWHGSHVERSARQLARWLKAGTA